MAIENTVKGATPMTLADRLQRHQEHALKDMESEFKSKLIQLKARTRLIDENRADGFEDEVLYHEYYAAPLQREARELRLRINRVRAMLGRKPYQARIGSHLVEEAYRKLVLR